MVATLALLGGVVGISPVEAQRRGRARTAQETDESRAAALFREAVELFRAGDFDTAAALLRRAHELDPEPILLFNLGRALEASNQHLEAADVYARYLTDAPEAEDRAAIEALIANLRARAEAEASANAPTSEPEPEATPQPEPAITPEPTLPPEPERPSATPAWVVFGVGAATVAAGLPVGLLARSRHDDARDAASHEQAVARRDEARRLQRTANALFGAGGALALGGLVWALVARRAPDDSRAQVEVGLGTIALRVSLR
jgi:tetratricopeptide (TPR) repeat protein